MPTLQAYAESSSVREESAIKAAIEKLLPADADELAELAGKFGITRGELKEAKTCAVREEGDFRTYWHLVQGLTAYARGFEYVDARIDLERRAGKILNQFLA